MKKALLALLFVPLFAPLSADLPPPYCHIKPMPPLNHGWYTNERQLQEIIEGNDQIKVVIEVGSWLGNSTISIAKMLPEDGIVYAVDHWRGSLEHQPGREAHHSALPILYPQFLSNVIAAGVAHKVIPIRMDSLEAAAALDVKADLIYLDASHDTDSVLADLRAWHPHLKEGGIMTGDDWPWGGGQVRRAVLIFAREHQLAAEPDGNFWRLRERNS